MLSKKAITRSILDEMLNTTYQTKESQSISYSKLEPLQRLPALYKMVPNSKLSDKAKASNEHGKTFNRKLRSIVIHYGLKSLNCYQYISSSITFKLID